MFAARYFPEPVQILVVVPIGDSLKLIGKGLKASNVYEPILNPQQIAALETVTGIVCVRRRPQRFRLGIEALRLGLAYEYDPYFSLSIARVDPLPHQLEAVYDYFLKLPRIRFLLADDPGRGQDDHGGLLLKELKIRGLVKRTLIVTPANLTFQWQRELKDKFRENFEVIRGDVLRANYGQNPWQEQIRSSRRSPGSRDRGRQGEPAPQPLGPDHRGRGAQDERLRARTRRRSPTSSAKRCRR